MSRLTALLAGIFLLAPLAVRADDWPQWLGPKRDGIWRETGLIEKFPSGGPKIVWRTPIENGFAGPAVAGGRVFITDRRRARDAKGELVLPTRDGGSPGTERVFCLNETDGKVIWKHEYDCPYKIYYPNGPRCTPLIHQGKVYTLGAMGDLLCLDAKKGDVIWSKNVAKEYKAELPVWGYAGHPLIEGDLLYCLVGGEGSAVVAFNKDTGREVWKALTCEEIGYAPPMIYEAGGKRQLIAWHAEAVNSLNPATGELYWTQPYPPKGKPQRPAVSIVSPARLGDQLYVSAYYNGGLMLKLDKDKPAASVLWKSEDTPRKPDGLHALMTTPVLKDGHLYGIGGEGEFLCQKIDTGEKVWESLQAIGGEKTTFGTVFLAPQAERWVLFNDLGYLILAEVSPKGYKEADRAKVLEPTYTARGRTVVWSAPAYANRCVYARNDKEIICISLAATMKG